MKLRLLYHGHCFDGVASAAVFTRFYRALDGNRNVEIGYTGLLHRPGALFDAEMFDGEENAIVDFKYSASPRLTWWFDHHQSAFLTPEDEAHFHADASGKKFWDPESKSCTEYIAEVARTRFDFRDEEVAPLVHWAHVIDGALYNSPAEAVELEAPPLQLMQVIESDPDDAFIESIIRGLAERSLNDVATDLEVRRRFAPIVEQHRATLALIKKKAAAENGVVFFDLTEEGVEGFNKFIPYYLYPEMTYSVAVTRGAHRTKISIGSNPWSPRPRRHNIATICERYGGGGHPVVGAISFGTNEVARAQTVAREVVAELRI